MPISTLRWLRPGSNDAARPSPRGVAALVVASALGLAPFLSASARSDPFVALVLWSVLALPCGAALGACGVRVWPFGLVPPVLWMLGYAFAGLDLDAPAPTPAWAGLAAIGVFALGIALGACATPRVWPATAGALVLAVVLVALPGRAALTESAWAERSPRLGAWLLDASPASLLVECAGLDWMRHRSVYHPAGTDWYSDTRRPYRGALASPVVLVVGCLLAWIAGACARRVEAPER